MYLWESGVQGGKRTPFCLMNINVDDARRKYFALSREPWKWTGWKRRRLCVTEKPKLRDGTHHHTHGMRVRAAGGVVYSFR